MSLSQCNIAYYSPCLQGSLSMAALQRECGGVFISNRASTLRTFRNLYPDVPAQRRYRHLPWVGGHKLLKNADAIFSGAGYKDYLSQFKAKKFFIFHGVLCAPEYLFPLISHFDHLFLIGPYVEQQILRHAHKYKISYSVTGYLPFALFPEKNDRTRSDILLKLGLNPQKKTIVYTPCKASYGTWNQCAENIARTVPDTFNLILRPHPNQSFSRKKQDQESFYRVNRILSNRTDSFLDLSECALPELLCVADLMITDANATAMESLFYDCPQLFADTNRSGLKEFQHRFETEHMHPEDTEAYLRIFKCGPSFYADGFTNWGTAVEFALKNADAYKEARHKQFFYIFKARNREAAKRIKEELGLIS